MPEAAELTGIAFVAVGALVCGIIVTRLRQPAVVGYIFAGVLLGPSGLAFVENRDRIVLLAELGVDRRTVREIAEDERAIRCPDRGAVYPEHGFASLYPDPASSLSPAD